MNKKGELQEVGNIMVSFTVGIISFIFLMLFFSQVYTLFVNSGAWNTPELVNSLSILKNYATYWDWGLLLAYFFTVIGSLVWLGLREFRPAEYIFSLVALVFFSIVTYIAGYMLQTIVAQPQFTSTLSEIFFIPFFAANSFLFAAIYFFIAITVMHAPR